MNQLSRHVVLQGLIDKKGNNDIIYITCSLENPKMNKKLPIKTKTEKVTTKTLCNPISQGTLYFSFSLILWQNKTIDELQIILIASFFTLISVFFFFAVFSKYIFNIANKIRVPMMSFSFLAFSYGFAMDWLDSIPKLSGIPLQLIVYFGFLWIVTTLLIEIKEFKPKPVRIFITSFMGIALVLLAIEKMIGHDYIGGGILIALSVLMIIISTDWLKLNGSVFE